MANDRIFDQHYSLNLARLKPGRQSETFELDRAFFEHLDFSPIKEGSLSATLDIVKYDRHLDVKFHIAGFVKLDCDRCLEPYDQEVDTTQRIIYAFDPDTRFDDTEVITVEEDEQELSVVQELYDFIQIALPLRRVPPPAVHVCNPDVLALLGLDPKGKPLKKAPKAPDDDEIDPRWEVLKKLKQQPEDQDSPQV